MREFDNQVQKIKNEILVEAAKSSFEGTLREAVTRIPFIVNPGPEPRFRCCVHHERAVSMERLRMVMGGDQLHPVEVLESACDQCPVNRYVVTEACRGCLAHRCQQSCPVGAVSIVGHKAVIDYSKCVECGKCQSACPYNAIADVMRPCRRKCPTDALKIDHRKKAVIDHDKCIACGQCVYQCPFGAIQEKSEMVQVIESLREGENPVYAIVAPAFATQFEHVDRGRVISAIKALGFRDVIEVALGADLVVEHEGRELLEAVERKQTMTSSCCPGFVGFIDKKYPELSDRISRTASPMTVTARLVKRLDAQAKVVFIGPCIAKKNEKEIQEGADFVLTFEELAAMIDARGIDMMDLDPAPLNNASYHGRKFAASGGVGEAISQYLGSAGARDIRIERCDGLAECDRALKLEKHNRLGAHFIEGMACEGGCIKGPVTMHHGRRDVRALEDFAKEALEETVDGAVGVFGGLEIDMER